MKDLAKVSMYLGVNIEYDEKKNEMSLEKIHRVISKKVSNWTGKSIWNANGTKFKVITCGRNKWENKV